MKKILAILAICVLFASMSAATAAPILMVDVLKNKMSDIEKIHSTTTVDWTGEFVGALGDLKKVNGEWNFTAHGYMAGVYQGHNRGRLFGNLYDLNETQVGTIAGYFGRGLLVGRVTANGGQQAPIVGFLFHNATMFIKRVCWYPYKT